MLAATAAVTPVCLAGLRDWQNALTREACMPRNSIHGHVTYIDMSPPPECIEHHDYSTDARVLELVAAMEARTARRGGYRSTKHDLRASSVPALDAADGFSR